jgi:hypothetical protein
MIYRLQRLYFERRARHACGAQAIADTARQGIFCLIVDALPLNAFHACYLGDFYSSIC